MSQLTYDWNGHIDMPIARPDLTDLEVAGMVRMLMRNQLNHEFICTLARDRIMGLSKEVDRLRGVLNTLEMLTATADGLNSDEAMTVHLLAAEGRAHEPQAWRFDPSVVSFIHETVARFKDGILKDQPPP